MNATCYHVRGYPLVEQMRADVAAGAIGEVAFVHGRYLCDDVLFPASGWRIDPARSGPSYVVGDLGTHWLDLAEHVTGRHVLEVLADFRSFAGGPLEDYAALLLRLDGGLSGSLVLSAGAAGRKNQLLFECEGTTAGLTWDQELPTEMEFRPATGRGRSSSRTRRRTRNRRGVSRAIPPGTARATGRRSATCSPTSTPRSQGSRTRRSRPSATATAASRRSRPPSPVPATAAGHASSSSGRVSRRRRAVRAPRLGCAAPRTARRRRA